MSKEELKRALEMFEKTIRYASFHGADWAFNEVEEAIAAIKEALAQPEQEPVAFYVYKSTLPRGHLGNVSDGDLPWVYDQDPSSGYSARMLVYTTPPQRKPLTDEQIGDISKNYALSNPTTPLHFARAIEAAHNIKE